MLAEYAPDRWRQLSIDPSVNSVGISVIDFCEGEKPQLIDVMTLKGERLARHYTHIIEVHGEKIAKLYAIERALLDLFMKYLPDEVICESPYLGRFPKAFQGLIECVLTIRRALMSYDRFMPLILIDPASVKRAVGVSGKSGDKGLMTEAIARLWPTFVISEGIALADLDEHSVDAIAIGIARVTDIPPPPPRKGRRRRK